MLNPPISGAMGRDLVPYDPEKLKRDQARVTRDFWDKLRKYIRRVPFVEDAVAAYYCAMDPATPLHVKAVLFGALAYFIVPLDIIPDFIGLVGFADDAAVLYAAIRIVSSHITEVHHRQARAAIDRLSGEPRPA
jgi:uncharacterized membrane protein YkvA (DUF1232 family)